MVPFAHTFGMLTAGFKETIASCCFPNIDLVTDHKNGRAVDDAEIVMFECLEIENFSIRYKAITP